MTPKLLLPSEIMQNKWRKLQFRDNYQICLYFSYRPNYGVRFTLLYDITLLLLTIFRAPESNKMACVFVVKPVLYVLVVKILHDYLHFLSLINSQSQPPPLKSREQHEICCIYLPVKVSYVRWKCRK